MFKRAVVLVLSFTIFYTGFATEDSSSKQNTEVIKLAYQIKLLQAQIKELSDQEGGSDIITEFGSHQNAQFSDDSEADRKNQKFREQYLQEQLALGDSDSNDGVDVGDQVKITTQGEVTYVGSFSGNNTVPIGQLPSNLFASSILKQRQFFDDYSVFFGGFIQADGQIWNGSDITMRNGNTFDGRGENIYLTSATLYFLANLGHYVTANLDFVADQYNNYDLQDAFVMFGNLDTTPVFVSVGKYRPSVGSYGGGGPWTNSITANMFRPLRVTNAAVNYRGDTANANFTVLDTDNHATFSLAYFDAVNIPGFA